MRKNYVLDTNVLIHDPQSIFQFEDNNLYVPIYVLEELDKLKSEATLRGRNSREVCRIIDSLRCQGQLSTGVDVGDLGGKFIVYVPRERKTLNIALDNKSMDNAILQCVVEIKQHDLDTKTILVTMDVNLRIRAECIDIQTASYESQEVNTDTLNNTVQELVVSEDIIKEFSSNGRVCLDTSFDINASIMLKSEISGGSLLGRVKMFEGKQIIRKLQLPNNVFGLKPKNREQQFALDLLLDDEVKLVTLMGKAGSGKTIITLASALYSIFTTHKYDKLLVSRPIIPMGKDIGFLPGTMQEKVKPYMKPIYDNIEYLLMSGKPNTKNGARVTSCEQLFQDNILEIEPLVYIRGRSIINQIMLIDESQSLSQHETKTIISRCGENTKIILTGDIEQIDNPYVNKQSNGLSAVVNNLHNHSSVGHILLEKGERSTLANLAVEYL
jgi:PhoH-like ATPase